MLKLLEVLHYTSGDIAVLDDDSFSEENLNYRYVTVEAFKALKLTYPNDIVGDIESVQSKYITTKYKQHNIKANIDIKFNNKGRLEIKNDNLIFQAHIKDNDTLFIDYIGVDNSMLHTGFSSNVYGKIEDYCKHNNIHNIKCGVTSSTAELFWRKQGFKAKYLLSDLDTPNLAVMEKKI